MLFDFHADNHVLLTRALIGVLYNCHKVEHHTSWSFAEHNSRVARQNSRRRPFAGRQIAGGLKVRTDRKTEKSSAEESANSQQQLRAAEGSKIDTGTLGHFGNLPTF